MLFSDMPTKSQAPQQQAPQQTPGLPAMLGRAFSNQDQQRKLGSAGADTNTSLSVDHLKPMPGGLDDRPLIASNNPEMFTTPGYLLRTSGASGARGDISSTFDKGFDLYIHLSLIHI